MPFDPYASDPYSPYASSPRQPNDDERLAMVQAQIFNLARDLMLSGARSGELFNAGDCLATAQELYDLAGPFFARKTVDARAD